MVSICKECNIATVDQTDGLCSTCRTAKKTCRRCGKDKSIFEFQNNQRSIAGRISRRGECQSCRQRKRPIDRRLKKEYKASNPVAKIGEAFTCPICKVTFKRQFTNDVVLDHSHETGEIRGYICRMCNSGMGMMEDSPSILTRAIAWLQGKLTSFL